MLYFALLVKTPAVGTLHIVILYTTFLDLWIYFLKISIIKRECFENEKEKGKMEDSIADFRWGDFAE